MLDKVVEACQFLLKNYPGAQSVRDYLNDRLSRESQDFFQFGYFPNINHLNVLADLVGDDTLLETGLLRDNYVEDSMCPRNFKICYFENHPLMMPYLDPYGDVAGLVCRTLLSESEMKRTKTIKYKNTKFKKGNCLFGLFENKQHILQQNSVYIVEGQFDVIKAVEIGFRNIVAIGNNNITSYQFSIISRYTNNIFMLLDNDESGEKGRKRTLDKYGSLANVRNFYVPGHYKDIDEYITKDKISKHADLSFIVKD